MKPVPKNWVLARLSEILETFESGGRPKGGAKHIKSGVPSIGGEHLTSEGKFNFDEIKYVPIEFFNEMTKGKIKKGDILIVKDGATTGKTAIVRSDFPYEKAAINEHVFIARPVQCINNFYLFYYLYSPYGQDYVKKNFKGTAQGGINLTFANNSYIPLPPLAEQHRIVAKIEELFTKLDAGVEALKKAKEQIKRYRQSVLKYAFEGKLTEEWRKENKDKLEPASVLIEKIKAERKQKLGKKYKELPPIDTSELPEPPEGWIWVRLGEISEINPKNIDKIDDNLEISFLPMKGVEELTGKYDLSIIKKYKEVKKGYTPFKNGDIIFAKITPCMENGKIAILENLKNGIGLGSTEFHVIRLSAWIPNKLCFYYLLQEDFRKEAQRKMKGTAGQLRVPANFLIEAVFPLPLLPEQQQIVSEIERRFAVADAVEKVIDNSLKQAERLRQSILKKAFEGKLVPQDPNDEPASELLKRIKESKENMQSQKSKNKGKK
ncbi:MAG: restriction endonuclease subunit S [candidate division WOR-3 bacterium]